MAKCSNEIYIPTKGSLLPMWKSSVSLMSDLHKYEDEVIATLGFGLHHRSQLGELDAQQTILTTCLCLIRNNSKLHLTHVHSVFTYRHPCLSAIFHLQRKTEGPASTF
jgi:hypothetical protein